MASNVTTPARGSSGRASGTRSGSGYVSSQTKYIEELLLLLGVPYKWGGKSVPINWQNTPNPIVNGVRQFGLDCSGLVSFAAQKMGIVVPQGTSNQFNELPAVALKQLKPGDLIFFTSSDNGYSRSDPGHVAVYLGHNRIIQAPHTGSKVSIASVDLTASDVVGFRRIPQLHGAGNVGLAAANAAGDYNRTVPTPQGSKNFSDNALFVLALLGLSPGKGNVEALIAQQQLENVNPADNNPFGLKDANGVMHFSSISQGLHAAAETLASNQSVYTALATGGIERTFSCQDVAAAFAHSTYEGSANTPQVKAANENYADSIAGICPRVTVNPSKPFSDWLKAYPQMEGIYGSKWWDPLLITGNPSHPWNPLSGVEAFYHAIERALSILTSAKTWYIVAAAVVVILGLFLLFHKQAGQAVQVITSNAKKGAEAAAVAA